MHRKHKEVIPSVVTVGLLFLIPSYLLLNHHSSTSIKNPLFMHYKNNATAHIYIDLLPPGHQNNSRAVIYDTDLDSLYVKQESLKPKKKCLIVIFEGRLGNNLFLLASVIGLSISTGRKPYFLARNVPKYESAKELFDMEKMVPILPFVKDENLTFMEEKGPAMWDTELYGAIVSHPDDIVVCCYLQSYKYFISSAKQIRAGILSNMFPKNIKKADDNIRTFVKKVYPNLSRQDLSTTNVVIIGVHVRRGDKVKSESYNVAPKSYFIHGMQYFREKFIDKKVLFIVASEDHKWSRANIRGPDVVHTALDGTAAEDMTLLSRCNHTLGSVGTYTWWAGFLAGGITVYYKRHTDRLEHSVGIPFYADEDYFLPDFIPLL